VLRKEADHGLELFIRGHCETEGVGNQVLNHIISSRSRLIDMGD
jgi:hypothetical protein